MANKSTAGVEAGRLHPAIRAKTSKVNRIFLIIVGFNGFKKALLTCQNFCAKTPAIRTYDFFLQRVIFPEAGHALHFCGYKTEAQLRMFRGCSFAELTPFSLKRSGGKFGEFAKGNAKTSDPLSLSS